MLKRRIKQVFGIFNRVDGYFVSYPKCGRTWVRFVIGKYISEFYDLNIPIRELTEIQHFTKKFKQTKRILFSHEGLPQNTHFSDIKIKINKFKNKKTIFLYRDPRPVVNSYYHHYYSRVHNINPKEMIPQSHNYMGDLNNFVINPYSGIDNVIKYMNLWAESKKKLGNKLLFVSYESLRADPKSEFSKILQHFGIPLNNDILDVALEFGSVENMSLLEDRGLLNKSRFGGNTNNSKKVRIGRKKKWNEELTNKTIEIINKKMENLVDVFAVYKKVNK